MKKKKKKTLHPSAFILLCQFSIVLLVLIALLSSVARSGICAALLSFGEVQKSKLADIQDGRRSSRSIVDFKLDILRPSIYTPIFSVVASTLRPQNTKYAGSDNIKLWCNKKLIAA